MIDVAEIDRILSSRYPETPVLVFNSPWTLLVAAILAAQCTDERVNKVTPKFHARFPGPASLVGADAAEVEAIVHSTGFYKQKASKLLKLARALTSRFGGEVPDNVKDLTSLPGVGRKTANMVLGNSMGKPAIFVDTHVKRLSGRLGLSSQEDPDKIEDDLTLLVAEPRRTAFSNLLTHLGRDKCVARNPRCPSCPLNALCPKIGV